MGHRPATAAFLTLATAGAIRGRVLDVGCGTGEHVLMCAALGLDATGVDLADRALHMAEAEARDRGLPARSSATTPGTWPASGRPSGSSWTRAAATSCSASVNIATIEITTDLAGIRAWLAALTRI